MRDWTWSKVTLEGSRLAMEMLEEEGAGSEDAIRSCGEIVRRSRGHWKGGLVQLEGRGLRVS